MVIRSKEFWINHANEYQTISFIRWLVFLEVYTCNVEGRSFHFGRDDKKEDCRILKNRNRLYIVIGAVCEPPLRLTRCFVV